MSERDILSKIALDINRKKIGKIIRVEKKLGKTIKTAIPHAIIDFREPLKGSTHISIDLKKIIEITEETIVFNILKDTFKEQAKYERVIKKLLFAARKDRKSKGIGKFGIRMSSLIKEDLLFYLYNDRNKMM